MPILNEKRKRKNNIGLISTIEMTGRSVPVESYGRVQLWGDLMRIRRVDVQDAGRYVCSARNQFGEQQAETHLSVTSKLNARIQPLLQVHTSLLLLR